MKRGYGCALLALVALVSPGCNPDAPWGYRVMGMVYVQHGPDTFPLANARVVLRDATVGGYGKKQVHADSSGRFEIQAGPWFGSYEVCADAPGLPLTCQPETFNLALATVDPPWREITIVATDALHGKTLLADGETPCAEPVTVELLLDGGGGSGGGTTIASTASNPAGEWMLGDLPPAPQSFRIRVRCAGEGLEQTIDTSADYRAGTASFDETLPNSPPVIQSIQVQNELGTAYRMVAPGSHRIVRAVVDDPDGDLLTYSWIDTADSLPSVNSASLLWSAPDASQLVTFNVTVDDGRGGVAQGSAQIRVGPLEDRFVGHVHDAASGLPLAGAKVEVGGQSVVTNADGYFGLASGMAAFHDLNVTLDGYAPYDDRVEGSAAGLAIALHPLRLYNVDPTQPIEIWDGPRGFMVRIPPNSLQDEAGNDPPGNVDVGIHTRNGKSEPSIGTAIVAAPGAEDALEPVQSASVVIRDASGARYNLKAGARATVGFTAPDSLAQPGVMPLLHLDEGSGLWTEVGETVQKHARYEAEVASFSSWSTGIVHPSWNACVHVHVKGGVRLPQILRIYRTNPPSDLSQHFVQEVTIQDHDNLLTHMPQNQTAVIVLHPFNDPDNILGTAYAATGSAVTPIPAYPWNGCAKVTLGVDVPAEKYSAPRYLKRIQGNQQSALAYYQSIGAIPLKDDFQKWLNVNQFPVDAVDDDVTFFNPNDLGLTRRANCNRYERQGVGQFACYVTKYGKLGESPYESLWDGFAGLNPGDTVAMEFTAPVNGDPSDRSVKFYIYAPGQTPSQQSLKLKTAFDTDGDTKYVPEVCLHCHGLYVPQFAVFDVMEYEWLGVGQSKVENIQEQMREWNSWVDTIAAHTNPPHIPPSANPARALIKRIYGGEGAVYVPGKTAHSEYWGNPVYDDLVKPYCRTCHMWSSFPFSPPNPQLFGPVDSHICTGEMPHAMAPQLALWSSTNPWAPSLLNLYCVTVSSPPSITITGPLEGTEVGFGGLSFETYTASVSDPEDGASCCFVQWSANDEGIMGYGTTVQYVFSSPGNHFVCAKAIDSNGKEAQDCIEVFSTNHAPSAVILDPVQSQSLFVGDPYTFHGEGYDSEYAYLELPCQNLSWQVTLAQNPPPTPTTAQGTCFPTFTFNATGIHSVALEATDLDLLTDQTQVSFNVVPVPPGSPPGVNITYPNPNDLYPPDAPLDLTALVTSHGGGPISLDWTIDWSGTPVTISTSNPDVWVPSDDVPFNCGGQSVILRLEATDGNGSKTDSVAFEIAYPPC